MKKIFLSFLVVAAFLAPVMFTSCNDDDNSGSSNQAENRLSGSVTGVRTLDASIEYLLNGPLIIEDGATLNIPAGTMIKAQKGFGSYILVLQGGKINVNGTAQNPVTMTSNEANPAAGDWGGLIINGRAQLTIDPATGKSQIGTTEINSAYIYGGENNADNSGTITYLKLEYTGARSSADVEHNGLTLNGVGSGTTINNVFVFECADDGIEFFGGTVNVTNLLVVNTDDDMFDVTQGWSGTLRNAYGIWEAGFSSTEADPRGVEADGNHDGNFPLHTRQSNFRIENMTIDLKLAPSTEFAQQMQDVIKIRRGAKATIVNALVKGIGTAADIIDMTDSRGAGDATSVVSITNALISPIIGRTINAPEGFNTTNLIVGGNNTGCASNIFEWTGYSNF